MEVFTMKRNEFSEWLNSGVWGLTRNAQYKMDEEKLFLEISTSDSHFC